MPRSDDVLPVSAPLVLHTSRRTVLRATALATSAAAASAFSAQARAADAARHGLWAHSVRAGLESYTPVALTPAELTVLNAAIDRLIPRDDLGPGAVDAGAFIYIDRTLAGDDAVSLPLIQAGLAALDQIAGSGGFAGLAPDRQDAILAQAEANQLANAPAGFFATLLEFTRRGMFGDPIHGGNKDFVGWDLIGYPGIKLVWSAEEQAIDAVVEPAHTSVARFGGTAS